MHHLYYLSSRKRSTFASDDEICTALATSLINYSPSFPISVVYNRARLNHQAHGEQLQVNSLEQPKMC